MELRAEPDIRGRDVGVVHGPFGQRGVGRVGVRVRAVRERLRLRLREGADADGKVFELVMDADVPVGVVLENQRRADVFPDDPGRSEKAEVGQLLVTGFDRCG